jgi:UDP-2,3-diacylglucosamine hydrolase
MIPNSEKIIFIADSHLADPEDEDYRAMTAFLDRLNGDILSSESKASLVILGDLFDFWVGYKKSVPRRYQEVVERLFSLSRNAVKIHYTEGNHDFFMGPIFTDHIGAVVHSGPWEIQAQGLRIYVAHGDQVNKKDYGYRLLRFVLRTPLVRLIIKILPSFVLEALGEKMSRTSRAYTDRKDDDHEEIAWNFALSRFAEGYDAVVIGHFHESKLKKTTLNGRECVYVNAGRWMGGNYDYVILERGKFKPMRFD